MENIDFWVNIELLQLIKPELFTVLAVIYIVGIMLKRTELIKDKHIPVVLSIVSFFICLLYFLSTVRLSSANEVYEIIFLSIVQGIMIAALTVYGNQLIKQGKKKGD